MPSKVALVAGILEFPLKGFVDLDDARQWAMRFVQWYNHGHRHSGIRYVIPALTAALRLPRTSLSAHMLLPRQGLVQRRFALECKSLADATGVLRQPQRRLALKPLPRTPPRPRRVLGL